MNAAALLIPKCIWLEKHTESGTYDACDVIVEMENKTFYTAVFVIPSYLNRQMDLSYEVSKSLPDMPPVRYVALETPHVIVSDLNVETIEDTIDNLLALDTFATLFTQVNDVDGEPVTPASQPQVKRATTEVAAVVLTEVLHVEVGP